MLERVPLRVRGQVLVCSQEREEGLAETSSAKFVRAEFFAAFEFRGLLGQEGREIGV